MSETKFTQFIFICIPVSSKPNDNGFINTNAKILHVPVKHSVCWTHNVLHLSSPSLTLSSQKRTRRSSALSFLTTQVLKYMYIVLKTSGLLTPENSCSVRT